MKICRDCANVMGDEAVNCLRCKSTNLASVQEKICAYCKTRIAVGTIICPHCHRVLPPESQASLYSESTVVVAPTGVGNAGYGQAQDMQNLQIGNEYPQNNQQSTPKLYAKETPASNQNGYVVPIVVQSTPTSEQSIQFVNVQPISVGQGQTLHVQPAFPENSNAPQNSAPQNTQVEPLFVAVPVADEKKYNSATQYILPKEEVIEEAVAVHKEDVHETAVHNSSQAEDMDRELLVGSKKNKVASVANTPKERKDVFANEVISRDEPKVVSPIVPFVLFGCVWLYILIAMFTPYMNHTIATIAGYEMSSTVIPSLRDVFYCDYAYILYGTNLLSTYEFVGSYMPFAMNIGIASALVGSVVMMISKLPKFIATSLNIFAFFCQVVGTVAMCILFGANVLSVSSILLPVGSLAIVIAHIRLA